VGKDGMGFRRLNVVFLPFADEGIFFAENNKFLSFSEVTK